jgi:RNA polymerase subunit RPABC4/transcription elongation factor Spt4
MSKLVPCLECKKKISSTAAKCPHCGSDVPNNYTAWGMVVILGVFIYLFVWPFFIKPMLG